MKRKGGLVKINTKFINKKKISFVIFILLVYNQFQMYDYQEILKQE